MLKRQGTRRIKIGLILIALIVTISLPASGIHAQAGTPTPGLPSPDAPCGVVNAIAYPIDGISTEHDDFGLYRAGFGGLHTGIDMAFGRYGDPVRAAARGRVTLADPNGWNLEKGVVIIEHIFPDGSLYYSLYGHMEQINGHNFPAVGSCVALGDVIGAVGHPECCAPHLHYEIRRMDGLSGGPGYSSVDPLLGGWLHPIDFTERWQLELRPAFRSMRVANSPPLAPPIFLSDGGLILAEDDQIERQAADGTVTWRLDVGGLVGMVMLPDNRLLALTADNHVYVINNGQFGAIWLPDHTPSSPPILFGAGIAFLTTDWRVASYSPDGKRLWQTDPLGDHIERYAVSGNQLAVSSGNAGTFKLSVIDTSGKVAYQAAAPSPIMPIAAPDGFYVLVASQIGHLDRTYNWRPLLDIGQPFGRGAQVVFDASGNVVVYPGYNAQLLAFNADGSRRWQADLPGPPLQPPQLAIGADCSVYALTVDGALLAFQSSTGRLRGLAALYSGGEHGHAAARWLRVLPNGQVQFAAGYLSIVTVDGPTLTGLAGTPCTV
ncbi:MAG: outer membrane protein assembly factor BamB family protein [Aggregatilineales bacterium]